MKITVIGAGPGGYETAIYAAERGAEVVLIEKDELGGTCLNRGCIPTKAYLASVEVLKATEEAEKYGIILPEGEIKPDYSLILERKNKVMESLIKGIKYLEDQAGVTVIKGTASIKDKNTVLVKRDDGEEEIKTDFIVLATGSVPSKPAMFKINGKNIITSDEVLSLDHAPSSMILVGGGVIGCEIGQFLHAMGTEMTIVEALPRLVATMDEDVSKQIARQFKKEKIKVICDDGIANVEPGDDSVKVTLASGKELEAECVLVAVGRTPYTENLGIENVNIEKTARGFIAVDEHMRTNVDNIYAIGDIVPSAQLAHVASKEGQVAIDNILGKNRAMSYKAVPGCVFTSPELASCGTLEKDLISEGKELDKDYKIGTFDFKGLGKAQATGHITGFVKIIADMNGVIIGGEIVGDRASDMLQVITTAVECGLTVEQVRNSIFPHPTMCEAIGIALANL